MEKPSIFQHSARRRRLRGGGAGWGGSCLRMAVAFLCLGISCLIASGGEAPSNDDGIHHSGFFAKCRDLEFADAKFRAALSSLDEMSLTMGGARLVKIDGVVYLVAVGATEARQPAIPKERMRRLTVARSRAVKELLKLVEMAHVEVLEISETETEITTIAGIGQSARVTERELEIYREQIQSFIKVPRTVATWISPDGDFFCLAIGGRIPGVSVSGQ